MESLKIFEKAEFGAIRVQVVSGEPMFCLADVCKALDLSNPSQVKIRFNGKGVTVIDLSALIRNEGVITSELYGNTNATFISEPNLYKCVFQSRKPDAEKFQDWICEEVIPTIRKTGGYVSDASAFVESYFAELDDSAKDFMVKTLDAKKALMAENKKQKTKIEADMPKVEFFDAVADSKDAVSMNDVAKVLNVKGMGRNNLFEFLRNEKILMQNNRPYQKYIDCSYFRVVEQRYTKNFEEYINFKTIVYQKGIQYIRKLLKERE